MGETLVYCDHPHETLDLKEMGATVTEDTRLKRLGEFTLSADNYQGNSDKVAEFLEDYGPIQRPQFACPYCAALGNRDGNVLTFITGVDADQEFIRLRCTSSGDWKRDDPQFRLEEEYPTDPELAGLETPGFVTEYVY